MGAALPKGWWDLLLSGSIFCVDGRLTDFDGIVAFQKACHREGGKRGRAVATASWPPFLSVVQAYGSHRLLPEAPDLDQVVKRCWYWLQDQETRQLQRECTCRSPKMLTHYPTCGVWASPQMLFPDHLAVRDLDGDEAWQPASLAILQAEHAVLAEEDGLLELFEMEATGLLGPCTCGKAPGCDETCYRVQDLVPTERSLAPAVPMSAVQDLNS